MKKLFLAKLFFLGGFAILVILVLVSFISMFVAEDHFDGSGIMYASSEFYMDMVDVLPIKGDWRITDDYGIPRGSGFHTGVDFAAPTGRELIAVVNGIVRLGSDGIFGLYVIIEGEDGRNYQYAHLSRYAVSNGQKVVQGQLVGYVGDTGRSTGPHLHFGVQEGGRWVNPWPVLAALSETKKGREGGAIGSLSYRDVKVDKLSSWLSGKNSMLASPERVSAILSAAKEYNVDPLLLVAITGQEQAFVPQGSSEKMVGNPFNVTGGSGPGSWVTYSPGLEKSARIAAGTVVALSKGMPEGVHPIWWLNSRKNPNGAYAEDPNWWKGVTKFYTQLKSEVG